MTRYLLPFTFFAAVAAATLGCATMTTLRAQEILANPGYETGFPGSTYTSSPEGTTTTWTAGGTDINNRILPNDWMIDSSGGAYESEWVYSPGNGAGGSDHFLYIPAGDDLCVEPLSSSMTTSLLAGTSYIFSVDLASADELTDADLLASLTTQSGGGWARLYTDSSKTTLLALDTSVTELSGSGDDINGRNLGTISSSDLDALNFAWSTYTFTFTTPTTYWDDINGVQVNHSVGDAMSSISLDVSNDAAGGGAFVIDNFSLQAVPEPTSALLLAFGGVLALLRRQRREVQ